jgi:hypothetical protein
MFHPSSVRGNLRTGDPGDSRSQIPKKSLPYPRTYRIPEWLNRTAPSPTGAAPVVDVTSADGVWGGREGPGSIKAEGGWGDGLKEAPGWAAEPVRSLPQYRHLMASSWISSAQ